MSSHQYRLEAATFDRTFGLEIFPAHLNFLRIIWWPDLRDSTDRPPPYDELPPFAYRPAPLESVMEDCLPEMAVLVAGAAAWLLFALFTFQRMDVQ